MKLQFCGVRGSTPSPGTEFVAVGGNTSCVAVWPEGAATPRLILDAGTGIRSVTGLLDGHAFAGTILLTHLHWDHVQGLPFFAGADRDDAVVRLLLPEAGMDAAAELALAMSPPHFPIGPDGLRGQWTFATIDEDEHSLEGLRVVVREVPHKGGRTFGYRVEDEAGSFAYVPDHLPSTGTAERARVVELLSGVDVLIHDAQFVTAEAVIARDYGHSTLDQAVQLADEARVRELVLFHYAPGRTDVEVQSLIDVVGPRPFAVHIAVEGETIDLAARCRQA